jgi:hypothetical protein
MNIHAMLFAGTLLIVATAALAQARAMRKSAPTPALSPKPNRATRT